MPSDPQKSEQIRADIAATLNRLRGDLIPNPSPSGPTRMPMGGVPSGLATAAPALAPSPQPDSSAAAATELRADPGMKVEASIGTIPQFPGMAGEQSAEQDGQPDLLAGLEPPKLVTPMSDDELAEIAARRRKRRNMLMAGVAAGVLLVGFWWFGSGDVPEEVPMIVAEQTPEKVKPESEGGLEVPNQGVEILNNMDGTAEPAGTETVLPAPETPLPPPVVEPDAVAQEEAASDPLATVISGENSETAADQTTPPSVAAPEPPAVPDVTQTDVASSEPSTDPSATVTPEAATQEPVQPVQTETASVQEVPAVSVPAEAPEPTPAAEPVQTAAVQPAPSGNVRVQLAAVKTEEAASSHWSQLQKAHPLLLGALSLTVEKVDKGADGIFFRVQAGPLADRTAAKQLCSDLKKEKQDCIVVR